MNKIVTNCSDCPLSVERGGEFSSFHLCRVSESSMLIYHMDDPEKLPAPIDCPLRTEPITISLT